VRVAAATQFSSSIAIVIGPTPPGTGVIDPATLLGRKIDVAGERPVGKTVHANVDHTCAGLDHLARDEPGAADGGDQNVGLARDRAELCRLRVAYRDGRVALQEQERERLADDI